MSNDSRQNGGRRDETEPLRASKPTQPASRSPEASRHGPGKVTLTSKLSPGREPAVQRKAASTGSGAAMPQARSQWELTTDSWMDAAHRGGAALSEESQATVQGRGNLESDAPAAVHQAAAAGASGAGSVLPYFDRIQAAFGGAHDVSQVRAHIGGEAAAASEDMGAEAYATGDHVAFRSQPDLHTAAHEAAHVVQQRAGVQLTGGVGRAGDAYEQQADAVADRVVRGQSAADLLESSGGAGAHAGASAGRRLTGGPVQHSKRETPKASDPSVLGKINDLLSYGAFDWAITDSEAREVLPAPAPRIGRV